MSTKNNLASNLRLLRQVNHIQQVELAKMLCVERATISKWENGKNEPELSTIIQLSEFYNTSLDDLITKDLQQEYPNAKDIFLKKSVERTYNAVKSATNNLLMNDELFMFPRVGPTESDGINMFIEAAKIDLADNGTDADAHIKMLHLYWDAFTSGVMDAGINTLRILSQYHIIAKANNDSNKYPFQARMEYIISVLNELEHPAGAYYEALALIYGIMETDLDEETAFEEGIIAMYNLANDGNKYAIEYVEIIEARPSQILCKPSLWCRIEAPQWRFSL